MPKRTPTNRHGLGVNRFGKTPENAGRADGKDGRGATVTGSPAPASCIQKINEEYETFFTVAATTSQIVAQVPTFRDDAFGTVGNFLRENLTAKAPCSVKRTTAPRIERRPSRRPPLSREEPHLPTATAGNVGVADQPTEGIVSDA